MATRTKKVDARTTNGVERILGDSATTGTVPPLGEGVGDSSMIGVASAFGVGEGLS